MAEPLFYLLSLAHSKRRDGVVLWHQPKFLDYTYRLEQAGKFTAAEVASRDDDRNLPVPVEVVDALAELAGAVMAPGMDGDATSGDRDPAHHVVRFEYVQALKARRRRANAPTEARR